LISDGVIRTIH